MLSDALKLLFETGRQAAAVQVVPLPGDPRSVLISQNGKHEQRTVPPAPRGHDVGSVDDFVAAVEHYAAATSAVWHNEQQVLLVIDDADRRDFVRLVLSKSEEFERIEQLAAVSAIEQRQMISLLRYDLRNCGVEQLVPIFRKLDWKTGTQVTGHLERDKETLGRGVDAAVVGTAQIPEEIRLNLKIYATPGIDLRVPVVLSCEPDVHQARFIVKPLPDELTIAESAVQHTLHKQLRESLDNKIGVFYGTPNLKG